MDQQSERDRGGWGFRWFLALARDLEPTIILINLVFYLKGFGRIREDVEGQGGKSYTLYVLRLGG